MKLNCDMGEGFGPWKMGADELIMPHIDMANIACGFHASDPQIMSHTVALAKKNDVAIGAHPGYPDLHGFGRRDMNFSETELINIVAYQVGALESICNIQDVCVSYVKPHGALYNMMMRDDDIYVAMLKAMKALAKPVPLMIMATNNNGHYRQIADKHNATLLFEAFCDRAYTEQGQLVPRKIEGAVHETIDQIERQSTLLIKDQSVETLAGTRLTVEAETLCIHGDSSLALDSVTRIRKVINNL